MVGKSNIASSVMKGDDERLNTRAVDKTVAETTASLSGKPMAGGGVKERNGIIRILIVGDWCG